MSRRCARRISLIAVAGITAGQILPVQAGVPDSADLDQIPRVVVTAFKTAESQQVVSVRVTAFSQKSLAREGVLSVTDLQTSAPGLFVAANVQRGQPTFAICAAKANNGTSNTVTAYIDDMPVSTTLSVANMVYDMQSVAVLKGLQGTLFWSNSTGGAIIFSPNKPSDKWESYLVAGVRYSLVNRSTGWKRVLGSRVDASFWAKNLLNRSYLLHTNNQSLLYGWANALYTNPRELGLDIRYNFF